MTGPSPRLTRSPAERVAAWLVTGPLGHLWSVVADITAFVAGSLATRARERLRNNRR